MNQPSIADARRIAQEYNLDGVIIIGISLTDSLASVGSLPSVSYGRNTALCKHFGKILDTLLEKFESGEIWIRPH